ncbi:ankyrin repeat domain-containing protein 50 [Microdochium nivale]|nr:ankyrin repeat domain-containing protein 50 [Microdochium nivale]
MDPVSLTVNIITLLDVGQKVIYLLKDVKESKADIDKFLLEAHSSCFVLCRLKDHIDRVKQNTTDADAAWFEAFTAVIQSDNLLGQYQACLQEILVQIQESNKIKQSERVRHIVTWRGTKANLEKAFQKLDRLKGIIDLYISSETLAHTISHGSTIRQLKDDTSAIIQSQLSSDEKSERNAILDWIEKRSNRYEITQSDYYGRAQKGTGQWFLESESMQKWINGELGTVYCPGIPGAGKTIMASIVTNHLQLQLRTSQPSTNIAVVYFNYKTQDSQSLLCILWSILWQFTYRKTRIDTCLKRFYSDYERGAPSVDDLTALLCSLVRGGDHTFIVLDALDELSNIEGPNSRKKLLDCIMHVQKAAKHNQARVLMTARPDTELSASVCPDATIQIYSAQQDLQLYLDKRLDNLDCLGEEDDNDVADDLRRRIVEQIIKSAAGMFLLAALHVDSLLDAITIDEVEVILADMPTGADTIGRTYEATLHRVSSQNARRRDLAHAVIGWIVHSQRPLTPTELQHAIAIKPGVFKNPKRNVPSLRVILSVCLGLVTVDVETEVVRLVHYTAYEYLAKVKIRDLVPQFNTTIAQSCLTYLLVPELQDTVVKLHEDWEHRSMPERNPGEFEAGSAEPADRPLLITPQWPFLSYAREYWPVHFAFAPEELSALTIQFFVNPRALSVYWDQDEASWEHSLSVPGAGYIPMGYFPASFRLRKPGPVSIAARWGLDGILSELLSRGFECFGGQSHRKPTDGLAPNLWHDHHPLVLAARHGHLSTAEILLRRAEMPKEAIERAICTAMQLTNRQMVEFLICHSPRSELFLQTLISAGTCDQILENRAIMAALTEKHDLETRDLVHILKEFAARPGGAMWIEYLLARYAQSTSSYKSVYTQFTSIVDAAASEGHQENCLILLDFSSSIGLAHEAWKTALHSAVYLSRIECFIVLMKQLAQAGFDAGSQRTLVHAAWFASISSIKVEVLQLLLANDLLDFNARDYFGDTWLFSVVPSRISNSSDIAGLNMVLRHDKCNLDATDANGRTLLAVAVGGCREFVSVEQRLLCLEALMQFLPRIWPNQADDDGRTALSWACEVERNYPVVSALLSIPGIDVNTVDKHGRTALSYCAESGDCETLNLLLGATESGLLDLPDENKRTPFFHAAQQGMVEKVQLFLSRPEINIQSSDCEGTRPLLAVLRNLSRNMDTAKALLSSPHFDSSLPDQTPLSLMIAFLGCYRPRRTTEEDVLEARQLLQAIRKACPEHDINTRCSSTSVTACLYAAQEDYLSFMIAIIQEWGHSVDLSIKDVDGRTAIDWVINKYSAKDLLDTYRAWPQVFQFDAARLDALQEALPVAKIP